MFPVPRHFDQNEWFVFVALFLSYALVFYLPKQFPHSISLLFMLFGATVARISDHLLASPHIDLYNLMDTPKFDLFDLILYLLYAPFSYFFVYYYMKLNIRGYGILLYIVLCSIAGTAVEWLTKLFHVFTYHGWHLAYSFTIYFFIQFLTVLLIRFILVNGDVNGDRHRSWTNG